MLGILNAGQIREADARTIAHEPVRSIDLMERAALACFEWIYAHAPGGLFPKERAESDWRFTVVCGLGNNGGDGLAIARLLLRNGYDVRTIIVHHAGNASPDHEENLRRLVKLKGEVIDVRKDEDIPAIPEDHVVIDALFGTGLSRPLDGPAAEVVRTINASKACVVAIDMPSGLASDGIAGSKDVAVHATHTLAFQVPRLAFFFRENDHLVGKWTVLPIGLDVGSIEAATVVHGIVERQDIAAILRPRSRFAHKGDHGHALLIAGGRGKMGAAVLAARTCVRSGAGLCTAHVPSSGMQVVQIAVPEAMCIADADQDLVAEMPSFDRITAIGIGPGIGTDARTASMLNAHRSGSDARPWYWMPTRSTSWRRTPRGSAFLPPGTVLTLIPRSSTASPAPARTASSVWNGPGKWRRNGGRSSF
jgi:NAD(P)H-hydrate epimerase